MALPHGASQSPSTRHVLRKWYGVFPRRKFLGVKERRRRVARRCLIPNSEIGMVAHAARVPVWAARPNLRLTFFVRYWREKVCGTRFSASRRKLHASGVRSLCDCAALDFDFGIRVNPTRPLTIPKVVKKEPGRKSPLAPGSLDSGGRGLASQACRSLPIAGRLIRVATRFLCRVWPSSCASRRASAPQYRGHPGRRPEPPRPPRPRWPVRTRG